MNAPSVREALRAFRAREARARNLPAYRILSNRTLDALARECPRTVGDLQLVPGIGPVTLDQYGLDLLALLAPYEPEPAPAGGAPAWEDLPAALPPSAQVAARFVPEGEGRLVLETWRVARTPLEREEYERVTAAAGEGRWVDLAAVGIAQPADVARALALVPAFEVAGRRVRLRGA